MIPETKTTVAALVALLTNIILILAADVTWLDHLPNKWAGPIATALGFTAAYLTRNRRLADSTIETARHIL